MALTTLELSLSDVYVTLFSSFIIGLAICRELRDIQLCDFALERWEDEEARRKQNCKTEPNNESKAVSPPTRVLRLLKLFSFVRQFMLIPIIIVVIPMLIIFRGRDALSICLNAIAVLFLLEIDNYTYDYGVAERLKSAFEITGHMVLKTDELKRVHRRKICYLVWIPICQMSILAGAMTQVWSFIFFYPGKKRCSSRNPRLVMKIGMAQMYGLTLMRCAPRVVRCDNPELFVCIAI